ncbi:MAG: FAD-binding oxidoreductase, partial [Moraxella osloensis]
MNALTPEILHQLSAVVGEAFVFSDLETRQKYGHDQTEDLMFPPAVVVKPGSTEEVAQLLKMANQFKIPVTAIGAQTGLSGGALSVHQGIGLSMERFNKILEIDEQNLQVIVEPAVITQVMREAVAEKGLFYPPDPSS